MWGIRTQIPTRQAVLVTFFAMGCIGALTVFSFRYVDGKRQAKQGAQQTPAPVLSHAAPDKITVKATLRELFENDFSDVMKARRDYTFRDKRTHKEVIITRQLYLDYGQKVKFVGFFVPSSGRKDRETRDACSFLAGHYEIGFELEQEILGSVALGQSTQVLGPTELAFMGRVYIYHEDLLSVQERAQIEKQFRSHGVSVVLRGPAYLLLTAAANSTVSLSTPEPILAEPNVTFDDAKISIQKVVVEGGRFRLFVPNETAKFMLAATVDVRNHAVGAKETASAGQVKAQMSFKLAQGTYDIAPGAWLDEPYNRVQLDVGDTRRLILAVSEHWIRDWRMVTNKRNGPTDAVMLDYSRGFPLLAKGTLEVSIINSSRVLRTLKASVRWRRDENLMLVPVEEG